MKHLKKFKGATFDQVIHILDTFDENFKSLEDHDGFTYVFYFLDEDLGYIYIKNDYLFEYGEVSKFKDDLKEAFSNKNIVVKIGFYIMTNIDIITKSNFTGEIKNVDLEFAKINKFSKKYKIAKDSIINDMNRLKEFYEIDYELGNVSKSVYGKLSFWIIVPI